MHAVFICSVIVQLSAVLHKNFVDGVKVYCHVYFQYILIFAQ